MDGRWLRKAIITAVASTVETTLKSKFVTRL
jgi:hypothetical protein